MSGRLAPSTAGNGKDIGKARGSRGFAGYIGMTVFLLFAGRNAERMDPFLRSLSTNNSKYEGFQKVLTGEDQGLQGLAPL